MAHLSAIEKSIYVPESATIVKSEPMTQMERFFELRLDSGQDLNHMPGQFVAISIPGIGEAPISISSSPDHKGAFQLVVRQAGRLTSALHKRPPGAKVGVRGPFGTHFPVEQMKGKDIVFITGGIGLVPVRSAIHYVLNRRQEYGNVSILFGTKSPPERLFVDELASWATRDDVNFLETVDKGDDQWKGNVGVVTTLIHKANFDPSKTDFIVCGPPVMYRFVILELMAKGVPNDHIYVSLERRMKCGVGKCGHCQINGLYACQDGPVFRYSDVVEVQEAI
ncbi:MAG: FAD/NAD(P)-binding protein [Chloroflexota bacterium]